MKKRMINSVMLTSVLAISIFALTCSDRETSSEPEVKPGSDDVLTVTDIDGNVYPTVKIGSQLWMAENLRVTHYRNGEPITNVTGDRHWQNNFTEAYCSYDDSVGNAASYGLLYNWFAVNDERSIAPVGWHVPSDAEWQTLIDHLGGSAVAGDQLKSSIGWFKNGNGSNRSKFSARPGGVRFSNGVFDGINSGAYFWSSTGFSSDGAWDRLLSYVGPGISRDGGNRQDGISVRCVKDK
jgi:uncharacterized protein (TIGR02145 family)